MGGTLYQLNGCPYCERVVEVLDEEYGVRMAESERIVEYLERTYS